VAAAPARTRLHIPLDLSSPPPPPPTASAPEEHTVLLRELLITMQRMCALMEVQMTVQQALVRERNRAANHRAGRYRGAHRARPNLAYRAALVSLVPVLAALSFVAVWATG
jgi:hypothetical protein